MSANASERGVRSAVLNSKSRDFGGYVLRVDCGTLKCGGSRPFAIEDLARVHDEDMRIGMLLIRLRCRGCGRGARHVVLETGAELTRRGRMRRLALTGPMSGRDER